MNSRYFDVNGEGHSIRCKLYYNNFRSVDDVVIFGHGFGGHKDNKAAERFAEVLLSKYKDHAVLTFNWPCHGDDVKKKLRAEDCMTYIRLVTEHVKEQFHTEHINVYATSFGGYLFLKYIAEHGDPFHRIALRCPAIDMYGSLTAKIMKLDEQDKILQGKEVLVGFDRKISVGKSFLDELETSDIRKYDYIDHADDILILQGTKDTIVPIETVKEFAENNVIEFIPVENADHRFQDPALMGNAIKSIIGFLYA